jgi:ABC-2 type transport system permease protein
MFSSILFLEKKLLSRSRWVWLTLTAFVLVGFWSVQNGIRQYAFYKTAADSIIVANNQNFAAVKAQLDTLVFDTAQRKAIETPFTLDWRLKYMVSRPVNPLSVVTIGQNDVSVLHKSARMNQPVFSNDFDEFKNPNQLLAGAFDFTFYLLFLYPLLLFALTYSLGSIEREQGIWNLWKMTGSLKQKIVWRTLIRWALSLLAILVPMIYAFSYISAQNNFSASQWIVWCLLALGYTFFWLVISILITTRQSTSMQNILGMISAWIIFLVIIPGFINTLMNYGNPDSIRLDVAEFRDVPEDAWNAPDSVHRLQFMGRYQNKLAPAQKVDSIIVKTFGYLKTTFDAEKKLHATFVEEAGQHYAKAKKTFWFNPAGAFISGFSHLAESSLRHQLDFEEKLYALRKSRFELMFDNLVLEKNFTAAHLKEMPIWEP